MNNSKLNTILWVVSATLLIVAIAFAIAFFTASKDKEEYKKELEFMYEKSFYELIDNVNNIEMNLSKLSSTNSQSYQADVVDDLLEQSNMAQNNLASLPLTDQSISKTISFINSTNGYCTSLSSQLAKGQALTDDQKYDVEALYESAKNVKQEVNRFATLLTNDYSIVDNMKYAKNTMDSNFSNQFATLEEPSVEYPQLIYDGPFSDSVLNKEIKGLSDVQLTKDQAQAKITQELFGYDTIKYSGQTDGKFVTYNFTLNFSDGTVGFAQVTKQGGLLLTYTHTHSITKVRYSQEDCVEKAKQFVEELGITDMESVWYAEAEGYLFVNLAYKQDDVIVYPDLIKVKVAMDDGTITGLEAMSYAYNHTEREIPKAVATKADAERAVQPELIVQKTTLCIMPNEYVGESLAWELQAVSNGNQFYAYVDAQTGQLLKVLKVIETDDGSLLM